ncbi:Las1 domain containing protein [Babesia gibsoni]|uniref:Las1 domain containing protein n=1 Tax=Babesia gibsoni TaxID=33632 RepID=A0AAD8PEP2_BABGI|nr:Las1 domain containing protein [Babesia gibsoni]
MVAEATGWYSYEDFTHVFSRLRNPEDYPYIATKIALWMSREKVPSALVATESLLSAVIADQQGSLSECGLRNLYAMAIVRAVNLLLDHEQDREYARSLKLIAKECDLPEYIITVRHECCHREIPDINTLRLTALDAINYVYQKYWVSQYKSIMYKLQNKEYDKLALYSLLISCHITALTKINACALDTRKWKAMHGRVPSSHMELVIKTPQLKSAILSSLRSTHLASPLLNVTYRRKKYSNTQVKANEQETTISCFMLIQQVAFLAKRLIEGCIHDEFFVSVFVNFVFVHFDPSPCSLFPVILLETIAQLPFNFTVKLAAEIVRVVFELDIGVDSDAKNVHKRENGDTTELLSKYLKTKSAVRIQKMFAVNSSASQSTEINSSSAFRRVNTWLTSILEWALHDKGTKHRSSILYATALFCSPGEDARRMWINVSNGLTRFTRAIYALLPHLVTHISEGRHSVEVNQKQSIQPWENDRLSHAMGLYLWLQQCNSAGEAGKYRFYVLQDSAKRDIMEQMSFDRSCKIENLDSLLLPGTLWDPDRWAIKYTVPLYPQTMSSHERITNAMENIMEGIPIKVSNRTNRRFERLGRRMPHEFKAIMDNSSAFLHTTAHLITVTKNLCHRERYS